MYDARPTQLHWRSASSVCLARIFVSFSQFYRLDFYFSLSFLCACFFSPFLFVLFYTALCELRLLLKKYFASWIPVKFYRFSGSK